MKLIFIIFFFLIIIPSISALDRSQFDFDYPEVTTSTIGGNLTNLSSLIDTNIPAPNDADVLTWNTATARWIASVGAGGGDNVTWNQSFANTLYISQSEEGNLNVNGSDWWNTLDIGSLRNVADILFDWLGDITITSPANWQFLRYDSGTGNWVNSVLTINETIDLRTRSIEFNATTIDTLTGTLDSGNLASVQTRDNEFYNVSEVTGVPGFNIQLNFTGVDAFNSIVARLQYDGNPQHTVMIELRDCTTGNWDKEEAFIDTDGVVDIIHEVLDSGDHICGADQNVSLRIIHTSSGNPAHDIFIDGVHLVKGSPITSVTEIDPLSLHRSGDVINEGNQNWGGFNLTNSNWINALFFNGSGANLVGGLEMNGNEITGVETISATGSEQIFIQADEVFLGGDDFVAYDNNNDIWYSNAGDDLGSVANKWANLYLSGTAHVNDILSSTDLRLISESASTVIIGLDDGHEVVWDGAAFYSGLGDDLGSSVNKWGDLWLAGDANVGGDVIVTGNITSNELTLTIGASQDYKFLPMINANRLAWQSQTSGLGFFLGMFNKLGDGTDPTFLRLWGKGIPSNVAGGHHMLLGWSGTDYLITAGFGNLILSSSGGLVRVNDDLDVVGDLDVAGDLDFDNSDSRIFHSGVAGYDISLKPEDYGYSIFTGASGGVLKINMNLNITGGNDLELEAGNVYAMAFIENSNTYGYDLKDGKEDLVSWILGEHPLRLTANETEASDKLSKGNTKIGTDIGLAGKLTAELCLDNTARIDLLEDCISASKDFVEYKSCVVGVGL